MNRYSHSRQCNICRSQAQGRLQTFDYGNEIVTEAKYICPRCGNLVAKEIVERKSKEQKGG